MVRRRTFPSQHIVDPVLDELETFRDLLPDVRAYIRRHIPDNWPDFSALLRQLTDEPLGPLAILPLASCAAAGGDARAALPVAATWVTLNQAIRILDDLEDQDRPDALWTIVGVPRAFNFSAALYAFCLELLTHTAWPAERYRAITRLFLQDSIVLAAGQDRDLCHQTQTLDDYWSTIETKNARAFALACATGAMCADADSHAVAACDAYGYHLGLALQLLDDFEGFWEPDNGDDLLAGKITLPLLYGCSVDHPERAELQHLVATRQIAQHATRIRSIIARLPAREFVVWTALQERALAVKALESCPSQIGVAALRAYADIIFADLDQLVPQQTADTSLKE